MSSLPCAQVLAERRTGPVTVEDSAFRFGGMLGGGDGSCSNLMTMMMIDDELRGDEGVVLRRI